MPQVKVMMVSIDGATERTSGPSIGLLESAVARLTLPHAAAPLKELSVVELLLLVCFKRLIDKEVAMRDNTRNHIRNYDYLA